MGANSVRGEVEIKLGDRTLVLRPTFDALVKIEDELGTGMVGISQLWAMGRGGIRVIEAVLWNGSRATEPELERKALRDMIVEIGIAPLINPVGDFILGAFGPPTEDAKKNGAGTSPKISSGADSSGSLPPGSAGL